MDYFHIILTAILAPFPIIHFWLHALLSFWRKRPLLFYFFAFLIWVASFFLFLHLEQISSFLFIPAKAFRAAGYFLGILGAILVLLSLFTLGLKKFFLWTVLHPLLNSNLFVKGIFRFIPHPAYLGYLLISLGNFLSSGKLYLGGVFIFLFIFTPLVIFFEDEELQKRGKK